MRRISLLLLLVGLAGCSTVKIERHNDESLDDKVLIARQSGSFKAAVTQNIIDGLGKDVFVMVVDADDVEKMLVKDFDAIVILDRYWNGTSTTVNRFVAKAPDKKSIILLVTSGGDKVELGVFPKDVDVMTTASNMHEITKHSNAIIAKIKQRL
jgi:hypothetical protein